MRQLARTLLILGSVGACERAHPVVDSQERPAVGNIGQTGRPKPAAIAQPLVDPSGAPAVGNIGQTGRPAAIAAPVLDGAPPPIPARRVHRVQRATRAAIRPNLVEPRLTVERPLVNREERPMTGNMLSKQGAREIDSPAAPSSSRLGFQANDAATRAVADNPLLDRRGRPANANMGRRGRLDPGPDEAQAMHEEQHRQEARE